MLQGDGSITTTHDVIEWARWLEGNRPTKILAQDHVGPVFVSTVFLGIDHSFGGSVPVLFETMVFGGPYNELQWRYATRESALEGHAVALAQVQGVPFYKNWWWYVRKTVRRAWLRYIKRDPY